MILVTGSLAFDFIMNFPGRFADHIILKKIHTINLSFLVDNLRRERGGCAANVAYNLALLGEKVAILGVLGRDGRSYKKWLGKQGIDVSGLTLIKTKGTSSGFIMTDSADNQITGFYEGAMKESAKLKIPAEGWSAFGGKSAKLKEIELVVIAPNDPGAMIKFAKKCQDLGIPYLFDPGMQLPRLSRRDLEIGLKGAKIVIGNDYEMELINQKLKIKKDAIKNRYSRQMRDKKHILKRRDVKSLVFSQSSKIKKNQIWVTTLGEKGSVVEHHGKMLKIKAAKPQNTSDPTGAGDAYRAGFVYAFLKGFDLKTCGQIGSVCAVYTVEKYGTTTHRFTKKKFEKRYKENYGETIQLR